MQVPISVVIPVFNGKRYIREALESLAVQTFRDFELIIVDDGSDDGTDDLIREYAHFDSRIRLVFQQHAGLVAALNRGCALARGRYIARLDSDDTAKPWRLDHQFSFLHKRSHIALVGGSTECIDEAGTVMFTMKWPTLNTGLRDYMQIDCQVAHTTVMFRKEAFERVGGYRSFFVDAEDYDLFMRFMDSYQIDNLPEIIGQYRIHDKQVSSKKAAQQIISGIAIHIASRARRRGEREWDPNESHATRSYLLSLGVHKSRIDAMIEFYKESESMRAVGWRWRRLPFCETGKDGA